MSPGEIADRLARRLRDEVAPLLREPKATEVGDTGLLPRTPWLLPEFELAAGALAATRDAVVRRADEALAGRISLLGLGVLSLGNAPDSHVDPMTGLRAPFRRWDRVPFLDAAVVGDHKGVWELNRHQWLGWIAQAFVATGDERYAAAALASMTRWCTDNPQRMGINWVSSLELSLRCIGWTHVLHLLRSSREATPVVLRPVVAHLELQMLHVRSHLSTWFAPNTHLTGEALGLLIVGTAFPAFRDADEWRECGRVLLEQQVVRQLAEDGAYFEQSSWYLAYTVDYYAEALRWMNFAGSPVSEMLRTRVHAAAHYLRRSCRPDGSLVLVGDDDGGTLWRHSLHDENPHRATLARAAARFADHELVPQGDVDVHATSWLDGSVAVLQDTTRTVASQDAAAEGRSFSLVAAPHGGMLRISDGVRMGAADVLLFDAGPHGMYGHPHADALAVDLSIDGRSVVVDPGTGSYVGALREQLRSTAAHATLEYAGQPTSMPNGAFGWTKPRGGVLLGSGAGASLAWAHGRLTGSLADGYPFEHERLILRLRGRVWLMLDLVTASAPGAPLCLRLPLAEGIEVGRTEHGTLECRRLGEAVASVCVDASLGTQVATAPVSSAYGRIATGRVIEMRAAAGGGSAFCTAVGATRTIGTLSRPDVAQNLWVYADALGTVVLMAPREGAVQWGDVRATGSWIVLEGSQPGLPAGAPVSLRATGRGALRYAGVERVLQGAPEEIELDLTPDLSIPSLS
ncbi:MAG: alginate lyase family protein [Gemmatimonadota bacterium]